MSPSAVRIVPGEAFLSGAAQGNRYFHDLYNEIFADLKAGKSSYWGLEGREHTAQVSQRQREWREWRFRFEKEDRENLAGNVADLKAAGESEQFLPALFCSPTMELRGAADMERQVLEAPGMEGIVLRYGFLYGHGTWSEGPARKPALHVDAAAHAALIALTRGAPGIYNIADEDGVVSIAKARAELGFDPRFRLG